ncbi:reverse transcriptase domain-containing protein [Tanacetum coccineum]
MDPFPGLNQIGPLSWETEMASEEGWNRIEEYVQYQDDLWDDLSPPMNVSSISKAMQPTFRGRLKRACNQISYLETPTREVCLSGGDIYDDPSLLRFYQNNDTPPWGDSKRKEKGEDGSEWIVRNKFEDELANFMLKKKSHTKGIGEMLDQHLKKQKKDDEDERLLSIFKQIHINLPFLEAMIHMSKGYKKEGDPGSFTLLCLIRPMVVKNTLADLGASINLMPHSLFRRLGISKLKPTKMSIQLVDRSIKYPIGVGENLLVKVIKFILLVDFVLLEIDEDELVPIIFGRPFRSTARAVIDVHEGKFCLRVRSETITFNIGKSMKSKHSRDDYLYCADHTTKLVQE